jgi:AAA domain
MTVDDLSARGKALADSGKYEPKSAPADEIPLPPEPDSPEPPVRSGHRVRGAPAAHLRYPTIDWHRAFERLPEDVDWLVPDFLVRGLLYALISPAKAGKSLLMQDVAAALATGRSALGHPAQGPMHVLYVDHENSRDDLTERLGDMGYGPEDLANLHYLSFPAMPPLDRADGGQDLAEVAEHYRAELVIIDTVSRVVAGEENSADTYRNFYRHALVPLKAARRTVVRLDHRGNDPAVTRARGSSAKADDIDVAWQLGQSPGPNGEAYVTLKLERQRGNAHPDMIRVLRDINPRLRHDAKPAPLTLTEQQGIANCIDAMKRLGLPPDMGARKARTALRDSGYKVRNEVVAAAVKQRKATCPQSPTCPQTVGDTSEMAS